MMLMKMKIPNQTEVRIGSRLDAFSSPSLSPFFIISIVIITYSFMSHSFIHSFWSSASFLLIIIFNPFHAILTLDPSILFHEYSSHHSECWTCFTFTVKQTHDNLIIMIRILCNKFFFIWWRWRWIIFFSIQMNSQVKVWRDGDEDKNGRNEWLKPEDLYSFCDSLFTLDSFFSSWWWSSSSFIPSVLYSFLLNHHLLIWLLFPILLLSVVVTQKK